MSEVDTFIPGQRIATLGYAREGVLTKSHIELTFPARIHITLLDANRFDIGQPGAGGLGFAVEMNNRISVSIAQTDGQRNTGDYEPVLAHMAMVMKEVFHFGGGFQIWLDCASELRPHSGLGATVCVMTACAEAINLLFGSSLREDEVRHLVGNNYAESFEGRLVRGTETGVGSYLALHGGFVLVSADLTVVYAKPFLPTLDVALIFPRVSRLPLQEPQNVFELERIKKEDLAFRYHKAYLVIMDLIPAIARGDMKLIGDVLWRLQFGGNNLLEFEKYPDGGESILAVMRTIRHRCELKPIVGISSLGPVVFALHEDSNALRVACSDLDVEMFLTKTNNEGIRVTELR